MNKLLCRFREFKEKCRRKLIRKLGGFVFLASEKHVIVKSTTVAPTAFTCKVIYSQEDLYDITPENLEKVTKERLRSKLIARIAKSNMVDFTSTQDEETGAIEMRATIWLVEPIAMREAKG